MIQIFFTGMDVHDSGLVSRTKPLEPGTVITVEPGVYIPEDAQALPEEFRGIGVRIEDDILISGSGGIEILSRECPKTVQELEELCT